MVHSLGFIKLLSTNHTHSSSLATERGG